MIVNQISDRLLLKHHLRIQRNVIEQLVITDHKASVNVGRFEAGLFIKGVDRAAVIDHESAKTSSRMDGRDRADLSRLLMACNALVDVDVGNAVSVSQQKSFAR